MAHSAAVAHCDNDGNKGIKQRYEALIQRHAEALGACEQQDLSVLCREVEALATELHQTLSRPTAAASMLAAECASPGESGCSGNGAGRRDGTSTTAVLRQLLLPGLLLCERYASGEAQLCVEAVAQLLLRLWMFALPCADGASELSKPDRKDLRMLVEVLLQELQPMPEGLRNFVQHHIRPVFGTSARTAVNLVAKAAGVSLTAPAAAPAAPAGDQQHAVSQAISAAAPAPASTAADGGAEQVSGAAAGSDATAGEVGGADTGTQRQLLVRKNRTKSASQAPLMRVRLAVKNTTGRAGSGSLPLQRVSSFSSMGGTAKAAQATARQQASRQNSLQPRVRVLLPKRAGKPSGLQRSCSARGSLSLQQRKATDLLNADSALQPEEVPDSATGPYRRRPPTALPKPQKLNFGLGGLGASQRQHDDIVAGDRLPSLDVHQHSGWLQPVGACPPPPSRPAAHAAVEHATRAVEDDWVPSALCTPVNRQPPGSVGSAERKHSRFKLQASARPPLASIQGSPGVADALRSPGRRRGQLAAALASAQALGSPLGASPLAGKHGQQPQCSSPTGAYTLRRPLRATRALFSPGACLRSPGAARPAAAGPAAVDGTPAGVTGPAASPPAAQPSLRQLRQNPPTLLDCTPQRLRPASQPLLLSPFAMPSIQNTPLAAERQPAGQQDDQAVVANPAVRALPLSAGSPSRLEHSRQPLPPGASPPAGAEGAPMSAEREKSGGRTQRRPAEPACASASAAPQGRTPSVAARQKRSAAPDKAVTAAKRRRSCAADGSTQGTAAAGRTAATGAPTADAVWPAKRQKPVQHEHAPATQKQRRQHSGPKLGCASCRLSQSGCRRCRIARISWLEAQGKDHTCDPPLVAMRERLGYGHNEVAKGVPYVSSAPADAAAACVPAASPAHASAAKAVPPAAVKRRSRSSSAPDCTDQEPTAASAPEPVAQPVSPAATASVRLQQAGAQQNAAVVPAAVQADDADRCAADSGAQPSSQPLPLEQPLSSVTEEMPSPDVQCSSRCTGQPFSPAAEPLPTAMQIVQQVEPAAAMVPLPQLLAMAAQPQDLQLTKATPAAVSKQPAVAVPATAAQDAAAKPAMATPTTDLPMLSSPLPPGPTGPPAAVGAGPAETRPAAAVSVPAVVPVAVPEDTGLTPTAQPAEQAPAQPMAARDGLRQPRLPMVSPAVASLFQSQRMSFAASWDVALDGLCPVSGSAKRHSGLAAPQPCPSASPVAAAFTPACVGSPVAPAAAAIDQAGSECEVLDQAPQPATAAAAPDPPAPIPLGRIAQFRANLCSSMARTTPAAVPRSAQRVASAAATTAGASPAGEQVPHRQTKRNSRHTPPQTTVAQSFSQHSKRRKSVPPGLAELLPETPAAIEGGTMPPEVVELWYKKRTPKPVKPFVAETSVQFNRRRQAEAAASQQTRRRQ